MNNNKFNVGNKVWWFESWTYITGKVEYVKDDNCNPSCIKVRTDCGQVLIEVAKEILNKGKCPYLIG